MRTQFSADLRLARRKAGYTQRDIAVLLGEQQSLVCRLERGERRPNLMQIITLSLIYGRSFESFFDDRMDVCKSKLRRRIKRLKPQVRRTAGNYNRHASVAKLAKRLEVKVTDHAA